MLNCTVRSKIPHFIPQIIPTSPDESDITGQDSFDSRMIPTSPDESDHPHPSFNPKVPGSRPGRPTNLNFYGPRLRFRHTGEGFWCIPPDRDRASNYRLLTARTAILCAHHVRGSNRR